jgi:hypothetical protein
VGLDAELVSLSDSEFAAFLARRSELLTPPPATLSDLANRAMAPYSVQACISHVRLPVREVLDGLAFLGEPSSLGDLAALAVHPPSLDQLFPFLLEARGLGLIVRTDATASERDALWTLIAPLKRMLLAPFGLRSPLARVLDRYTVADLRAIAENLSLEITAMAKVRLIALIVEELSDPARLQRVASKAPDDARALLSALIDMDGIAGIDTSPYAAAALSESTRWLFAHALLVPLDWETVIVPREVTLGLRGAPLWEYSVVPPGPDDGDAGDADRIGSQRSGGDGRDLRDAPRQRIEFGPAGLLETVASIGLNLAREIVVPLKTEGVGVRDVRSLAKKLGTDEESMARLLDLAGLAGFVAVDIANNRVATRSVFDQWLRAPNPERWFTLVRAWMGCGTSMSRTTSAHGRVAPLTPTYYVDEHPVWRRAPNPARRSTPTASRPSSAGGRRGASSTRSTRSWASTRS